MLLLAVKYPEVFSVEVLSAFGSDPNAKNHTGNTPLHRAIERRHVGIVELLLNSQADPTYSNAYGVNALALALSLEDSVIVEMLLKGVDGNGHPHKFNSLDRAASEGFLEKLNDGIELEKQKRIDHEKREAEDERCRNRSCPLTITELSWAAEKGSLGFVQELVDGGVDVVQQDLVTGKTALHLAVENERHEVALFLLRAGADKTIEDASGKAPIDYVTDSSHGVPALLPWRLSRD